MKVINYLVCCVLSSGLKLGGQGQGLVFHPHQTVNQLFNGPGTRPALAPLRRLSRSAASAVRLPRGQTQVPSPRRCVGSFQLSFRVNLRSNMTVTSHEPRTPLSRGRRSMGASPRCGPCAHTTNHEQETNPEPCTPRHLDVPLTITDAYAKRRPRAPRSTRPARRRGKGRPPFRV